MILQAANSQNITVSVWFLSESKLNGLWTEKKETVRSCLFVFFVLPCKEINRGAFGRFPFNKNSVLKLRKFQVPNGMVHSHRPDLSHHVFAYCSCKQDTTTLSNGKGHFGPTNRNDQTGESGPPSKLVPNTVGAIHSTKVSGHGSKIYATANGLVPFLSQTEKMAGVLLLV